MGATIPLMDRHQACVAAGDAEASAGAGGVGAGCTGAAAAAGRAGMFNDAPAVMAGERAGPAVDDAPAGCVPAVGGLAPGTL